MRDSEKRKTLLLMKGVLLYREKGGRDRAEGKNSRRISDGKNYKSGFF
ncbi:MAG: hypothetical protein RSA97_09360 [Oscillospiraceae bacterium]